MTTSPPEKPRRSARRVRDGASESGESKKKVPPAHVVRMIAVRAKRDPRSVERVFRGDNVKPIVAASVRDACRELGIDVPAENVA